MSPIITLLIGAVPVLILAGLCSLALYCLLTDKKHREQFGPYHNHPDKDMPLYNLGHCDRYSAGTFSW